MVQLRLLKLVMKIENREIEIIKTYKEIQEAAKKVAKKLDFLFRDKEVIWFTVMKGGIMFSSEVVKNVSFKVNLDFIASSSYKDYGKVSFPKIVYDGMTDLKGKNLIVVDDLIDTGETIKEINNFLNKFKPNSITNVAIFGKKTRLKNPYQEILAFNEEPKGFLVGFGLDIKGFYRNLPNIAIIHNKGK